MNGPLTCRDEVASGSPALTGRGTLGAGARWSPRQRKMFAARAAARRGEEGVQAIG